MEFWPARTRHEPFENKKNPKGHTYNYEYNLSVKGPVISTGNGTSTAAVLRAYRPVEESTSKRLEWDFIAREGKPQFSSYIAVFIH
jgi:hypothetical protein